MSQRLRLSDEDLARLREILQVEEVPSDFGSEAFAAATKRVAEIDPELAQRYILAVPDADGDAAQAPPLETEQQARRALNRQRVIDMQRRFFMREVDGEWVPNQVKIIGVAVAVLTVGICVAGYGVYADSQAKARARAAAAAAAVEELEVVAAEPVLDLPEPEPAPVPSVSIASLPTLPPAPAPSPVAEAPAPAPAPAPARAPVPTPPPAPAPTRGALDYNAYDPDETPVPITVAEASPGRFDPLSLSPLGVYEQTVAPVASTPGASMARPLTAFRRVAGEPAPVTAFTDPTRTPPASADGRDPLEPAAALTVARGGSAPVGGVVFAGAAPNPAPMLLSDARGAAANVTVFAAEDGHGSEGASATVYALSDAGASAGGMSTLFSREEASVAAPDGVPVTPSGGAANAPASSAAAAARVTLEEGARLAAELVTSATVLDGQPGPVLAQTVCGARDLGCEPVLFVGSASLLAGDRLVISFDRAVVAGEAVPVAAMALAPDMSTSIPARVVDQAPTVAQDMFRSALTGVSDYVQAMTNRTRTTIVDGAVVTESVPPSLEEFVLGRVAGSFGFAGSRLSFVRVAELPAGTPVVVLVGSTR